VELARLGGEDLHALHAYLQGLSADTRKRFGPHEFHLDAIMNVYSEPGNNLGFIARDQESGGIVAYAIVRIGFLEHDLPRFESYGIIADHQADCAFAPSVADGWQGQGLGEALFYYTVSCLRERGITRMFLWGGVQADNQQAVRYYNKLGFQILGSFQYFGDNHDMFYMLVR
jgi:ribosomal protein S18 acetylase RimI-like enzyme